MGQFVRILDNHRAMLAVGPHLPETPGHGCSLQSASEMLVLVASREGAILCKTINGDTRPIQSVAYDHQSSESDGLACYSNGALARNLIAMVERYALAHPHCDSVVILAEEPIYHDLCRMRTMKRCAFLIAPFRRYQEGRRNIVN